MKHKYKCIFYGCHKGAIGKLYSIETILESETPLTTEEVSLKLYDAFDHISNLKIETL